MDNSDRLSPSMDIYSAMLAASRSSPVTEQLDGFVGAAWSLVAQRHLWITHAAGNSILIFAEDTWLVPGTAAQKGAGRRLAPLDTTVEADRHFLDRRLANFGVFTVLASWFSCESN